MSPQACRRRSCIHRSRRYTYLSRGASETSGLSNTSHPPMRRTDTVGTYGRAAVRPAADVTAPGPDACGNCGNCGESPLWQTRRPLRCATRPCFAQLSSTSSRPTASAPRGKQESHRAQDGRSGCRNGNDLDSLWHVDAEYRIATKAGRDLAPGSRPCSSPGAALSGARAASSRGLSAAAEQRCQDPSAPLMHPGPPPEPSSP